MRCAPAVLLCMTLLLGGCLEQGGEAAPPAGRGEATAPTTATTPPPTQSPAPATPPPDGSASAPWPGPELAGACVHPEARGAARNAHPLASWNGTPADLLQRLADALQDPLIGEPREERDALVVETQSGRLEYWLPAHERAPGQMTWRSTRDASGWSEAEGEAWLRGVVDRFASAEDAARLDVFPEYAAKGWAIRFGQHVEGRFVSHAGGYVENGWGLVLYWGPAYALPERVEVAEADARATAEAYAACALAEDGRDESTGYALVGASPEHRQLGVVVDSLAHQVLVRFTEPEPHTHCGTSLYVHVDATTGAVLGHETPMCA